MNGNLVNGELERMWKEAAMPHFEVLPQHYVEVLRISKKNFSYDCLSAGPPEYEAGVPTIRARPSVVTFLRTVFTDPSLVTTGDVMV